MKPLYFKFLFGFFTIASFDNCISGGPCEEPLPIGMSGITFNFKDAATGKILYMAEEPLYNIDSLKITGLNGDSTNMYKTTMQKNNIPYYWYAGIYLIKDASTLDGSVDTEVCKEYIIQYSFDESDTIKVCFKSKYTQCTSVLETVKVYNKNVLLASGKNTTGLEVDIIKN